MSDLSFYAQCGWNRNVLDYRKHQTLQITYCSGNELVEIKSEVAASYDEQL